jgi:hypothetical protein
VFICVHLWFYSAVNRSLTRLVAALVLSLTAHAARAQDAYEVEEEPGVSIRALADLRVARGSEVPSWQEKGFGKIRYGGVTTTDGSFARVTRFAISQFALEPSGDLPWGLRLHAQVNWEGDIDDRGNTSPDHDVVRLIEGFVRKEWGGAASGYSVLAGVSNPQFSLENIGPAWTPRYTITPSALNTWLWEEGRVLGLQADWWHALNNGTDLSAFGGLGWGPDEQGTLLSRRGWVLSDWLAGINSQLPLPSPLGETEEFDERDGRPALYVGGTVADPWKIGKLQLGFFDNLGNLNVNGVWETYYGVTGVALQPLPGLDILFQYMLGKTTSSAPGLSSSFQALYPLVAYRWRQHRVAFRYDDFKVQDRDHTPPNTRERGHAFTVSYLFEFWLRHRIGVEYITVNSDRCGSSTPTTPCVGVDAPGDDGWQVSYRFRY